MLICRFWIGKAVIYIDGSSHLLITQMIHVINDSLRPGFPGISFPFPLHILQSDHNP